MRLCRTVSEWFTCLPPGGRYAAVAAPTRCAVGYGSIGAVHAWHAPPFRCVEGQHAEQLNKLRDQRHGGGWRSQQIVARGGSKFVVTAITGLRYGIAWKFAACQEKYCTQSLLVVAAFRWQVFPVPLAHHCVVSVCPFAAGFKIFQHLLFRGAKSRVGLGHLAHANKYDDAFKHA